MQMEIHMNTKYCVIHCASDWEHYIYTSYKYVAIAQYLYNDLNMLLCLGYTSIISSRGVLVDLTPPKPKPGRVKHAMEDTLQKVSCNSFVSKRWQHRCVADSNTKNYR